MLIREKEIEVLKRIEEGEMKNFKEKSLYEKIDHLTFEIPWLIARHYHHGDVRIDSITPKVRRRVAKKLKHNPFHYMNIFKEPFVEDIMSCDREDLFNEIMRQNMVLMIKDLYEMKVGRGEYYTIPEKKAPYYVYMTTEYGTYHPAEGGTWLSNTNISWCREFSTFKKALRFIRKCFKETDWKEDGFLLEGRDHKHWIGSDKQGFGMYSNLMCDSWGIYLSRKKPTEYHEHYC